MLKDVPFIDVAILSRDERDLPAEVVDSLRQQQGVRLKVHRIIGSPDPSDPHRIATIAKARNEAVQRTAGHWLMFVDDDVVLRPDCVARLHHALVTRRDFAAFAADYLGESHPHQTRGHVSMGATLFRRSALLRTPFRWEPLKCECLCCCEDLRRAGARIEYLPGVTATHLKTNGPPEMSRQCDYPDAKVLVAFNRRDVNRFQHVFLRMLRASGNRHEVVAVGYGLYPSERQRLAFQPGVRVIHRAPNGKMPPIRRLADFAEITATFDPRTPVAYWDASDVIIQASLDPLWQMTQDSPDKIFGVREPRGYPLNAAIVGWTRTIAHPVMRDRAFKLLSTRPFLNSGFSAGTAASMHRYFREAHRLRHADDLRGTADWGDQTAFNLYCHRDPDRWKEVSESWNYCVHDRPRGEVLITPKGRITSRSGTPIYVAHGNARSLPQFAVPRSSN